MNRIVLLAFVFFSFDCASAQSVYISGNAEGRNSGTVYAYRYSDAFTTHREILDECDINDSGGFHLQFNCNETMQIFLCINRVNAMLYVHPNEQYGVLFPDEARVTFRSFSNSRVSLLINPQNNLTDSLWKIDTAIAAFVNSHFFEYAYQQFRGPESYLEMARKRSPDSDLFKITSHADTTVDVDVNSVKTSFNLFSNDLIARYDEGCSQYVRQYLRYSLAELELMTLPTFRSYYMTHFAGEDLQLANTAYVRAFRAFFQGFLDKRTNDLSPGWSDSFDQLSNSLNSLLPMGSRELYAGIWILHVLSNKVLWNEAANNQNAVLEDIDYQFSANAKIHAAILGVKKQASFISSGRTLTSLQLADGRGERWRLEEAEVGYKYFLFFAQWNTESVKEIRLLERLSEKMKGLIKIYAVSCDADYKVFKKFLSTVPNSAVEFLFAGCNPEVDDICGLKLLPDAIMLDGKNRTMMPHAPLPSGRLEEQFRKITDQMKKPVKTRKSWKD